MAKRAQPRPNAVLLLEDRLRSQRAQTHPDTSSDDFFLFNSIDTVLRPQNLSYRQIENGTTDGADDGGIDAVYTFVNGRLVEDDQSDLADSAHINLEIIQAKNEYGFKEVAVQKLLDHLPVLLNINPPADLDVEFNDRILERFEIFRRAYNSCRFPPLSIRIRYIAKSTDPANVKTRNKARRLEVALSKLLAECNSKVDFIGAHDLNIMARKRLSAPLDLLASEQPLSSEMGGLVCLVSLNDWFNFISDGEGLLRENIFEENVRGFAGDTRINHAIMDSLKQGDSGSADFWWLNNGVTVLGRRVKPSYKTVKIEDPQIVNGLQTSTCIYQHFRNSLAGGDLGGAQRKILVRIIEAEDKVLSAQIIQATNSQNRVDSASLRATEPLQREIEEAFGQRGYYYERRKNVYKNLNKPRSHIIEILEVAQAMAAILLCEPHMSRGQPSALVRAQRYNKIFDSRFPHSAYLNSVLIVRQMEEYLCGRDSLSRQDRSNVRFQLARAATAFALASPRPRAADIAYLDLVDFTSERLDLVYDWILERRDAAASASRKPSDPNVLAKSAEWSRRIDEDLNYFSRKNQRPIKIGAPWT